MFCRNSKQQSLIESLEKNVTDLQNDLKILKEQKAQEETILKIEIENQKDVIEFLKAEKAKLAEHVKGSSNDSKNSLVGMISDIHSHSDHSIPSEKATFKSVDHLVATVKQELRNNQHSGDEKNIMESIIKALEEEHGKRGVLDKEVHQLSARNRELASALEHAKIEQQRIESKFLELEEKLTGFDDDESSGATLLESLGDRFKTPSERLDQKIAILNNLIIAKNVLIDELKEKNQTLKDEVEISHDELFIFKEETRKKLEHMRINFHDAQTKRDEWETRFKELTESHSSNKTRLEQEIATLREAHELSGKVLRQSRHDLELAINATNIETQTKSKSNSTDSISRSNYKLHNLEDQIAKRDEEISDLKKRLSDLVHLTRETQTLPISPTSNQDSTVMLKLKTLEDSLVAMKSELGATLELLKVSQSKEKDLQEMLSKARAKELTLETLKEQAEASASKGDANQISILESVKQELLQELEEKNKEIDSAVKEIENLMEKVSSQQSEIVSLKSINLKANDEIQSLSKSKELLQISFHKLESEKQEQTNDLKSQNSKHQTLIHGLQTELSTLKDELASHSKRHSSETENLKRELQMAQERVMILRGEVEAAQSSKSESKERLGNEMSELKARLFSMEEESNNLRQKLGDVAKEYESFKIRADRDLETLRHSLDDTETDRSKLQSEVTSLNDTVEKLTAALAGSTSSNLNRSDQEHDKETIKSLTEQVATFTTENKDLQQKIHDLEISQKHNAQRLDEEKSHAKVNQDRLYSLEAKVSEQLKTLSEREEKIKQLEEQLQVLRKVNNSGSLHDIKTEGLVQSDPISKSGMSILFKDNTDLTSLNDQQIAKLKEKVMRMTQELETKNNVIAQYVLRDQTIDVDALKQQQKSKGASLSMLVSSNKTVKDPALLFEINNKLQLVLADLKTKNQELEDSIKRVSAENRALKEGLQPI